MPQKPRGRGKSDEAPKKRHAGPRADGEKSDEIDDGTYLATDWTVFGMPYTTGTVLAYLEGAPDQLGALIYEPGLDDALQAKVPFRLSYLVAPDEVVGRLVLETEA